MANMQVTLNGSNSFVASSTFLISPFSPSEIFTITQNALMRSTAVDFFFTIASMLQTIQKYHFVKNIMLQYIVKYTTSQKVGHTFLL